MSTERRKFSRVSDWHDYLEKTKVVKSQDLIELRKRCYTEIEQLRGRPLLVYYVQYPSKPLVINIPLPISIDLDDIDGFVDLVESVDDGQKEVDVLINSPGGSPEATERIVALLRERFEKVCFLIPHSAYSAATMMALSGNEIVMHPSASLGPIDPQINGTPARAVRRGFDKAREALKDEGPHSLPAYLPLIEKYSLELLEICSDYEDLSKELVSLWLKNYMFRGKKKSSRSIKKIVDFFADYDKHKTHSRPLTYQRVKDLGLNIHLADEPLKSLLREAHLLLNGLFEITPFVKLYENNKELSWGRQVRIAQEQQPNPSQK